MEKLEKNKYCVMKAKIPSTNPKVRDQIRWSRIGRVTITREGKMLGTIENLPLNWNGEFAIFEVKDE